MRLRADEAVREDVLLVAADRDDLVAARPRPRGRRWPRRAGRCGSAWWPCRAGYGSQSFIATDPAAQRTRTRATAFVALGAPARARFRPRRLNRIVTRARPRLSVRSLRPPNETRARLTALPFAVTRSVKRTRLPARTRLGGPSPQPRRAAPPRGRPEARRVERLTQHAALAAGRRAQAEQAARRSGRRRRSPPGRGSRACRRSPALRLARRSAAGGRSAPPPITAMKLSRVCGPPWLPVSGLTGSRERAAGVVGDDQVAGARRRRGARPGARRRACARRRRRPGWLAVERLADRTGAGQAAARARADRGLAHALEQVEAAGRGAVVR